MSAVSTSNDSLVQASTSPQIEAIARAFFYSDAEVSALVARVCDARQLVPDRVEVEATRIQRAREEAWNCDAFGKRTEYLERAGVALERVKQATRWRRG